MRTFLYMMSVVVLLSANVATAEETVADARKHMVRGVAAIEMAKSNSELELAANEFGRAAELDPVLSSAWFNLGSVQAKLGKYEEAIKSYRRYLELVPNAEDAMKVEDEIIKLEFRQEQVAKVASMVGTWLAPDNTPYRLDAKGSRLTLATDHHPVTENEVVSTYTLVGTVPVGGNEQVAYRLERVGANLSGTWWHSAIRADKCKVPEETGEVTGEISADNGTIVLRYTRNKYRAATQMSLMDDYCGGVSVMEKRKVELVLKGPLQVAAITGLSFEKGSFDRVPSLRVYSVEENSTAAAAGLKEDDLVVAIDGVAVQEIAAPDIWFRLRGEVGSEVVLSVQREGEKQPLELRAKRLAFPEYRPKAAD